jgi:hypothetical protein
MLRELDTRVSNGLAVQLYWDSDSGEVLISLGDERSDLNEVFPVPAACALDAFAHPFVYLT